MKLKKIQLMAVIFFVRVKLKKAQQLHRIVLIISYYPFFLPSGLNRSKKFHQNVYYIRRSQLSVRTHPPLSLNEQFVKNSRN
jgi:hypothetical protein